jgi:hypothetical protein
MSKVQVGNLTVIMAFDVIDVDIIQLKTPVQTGALRDGFTIDLEGDIINMVDYADEVEFGTTDTPGRFMVTQSLGQISERLAKRMAEQIDNPKIVTLPEIKIEVGK